MLTDTVSSDGCTRVAPRQNPGAAASNPFYLGVKLLKYAQKLITASLTQSGMGMGIYVDDSDNVVGNTAVLGRDLKQRMNFSG